MAAIQSMLPPQLEDKVKGNAHTLTKVEDLKKYVCEFCFEARTPTSIEGNTAGNSNLEIDLTEKEGAGKQELEWSYEGHGYMEELNSMAKGKSKGKGGSNFDSYGKGGGNFDGYCNYCGNYGHRERECRKLDAKMRELGKGGGKAWKGGFGKDGHKGGAMFGGKGVRTCLGKWWSQQGQGRMEQHGLQGGQDGRQGSASDVQFR